jgi:hypothetical protein
MRAFMPFDQQELPAHSFLRRAQPPPPRRVRGPIARAACSSLCVMATSMLVLLILRFAVLTSEAFAMIVSERAADNTLLELCAEGRARESPLMRAACMQATVDRASPAFARAITRGAYSFANELYALLSVPFKAISLASAVGVLGVLPWLGALRTLLPANVSDPHREAAQAEHTVVILQNGERAPALTAGSLHKRGSVAWPPMLTDSGLCETDV